MGRGTNWLRSLRPRALGVLALGGVLVGCLGMPDEVQPVRGFDAERYLGRWYEIARLDHSFERDLINVTANYSYAFVSGFNHDYLWLLAREPSVPDALRERFLRAAEERGFAIDEIIWVEQSTGG